MELMYDDFLSEDPVVADLADHTDPTEDTDEDELEHEIWTEEDLEMTIERFLSGGHDGA